MASVSRRRRRCACSILGVCSYVIIVGTIAHSHQGPGSGPGPSLEQAANITRLAQAATRPPSTTQPPRGQTTHSGQAYDDEEALGEFAEQPLEAEVATTLAPNRPEPSPATRAHDIINNNRPQMSTYSPRVDPSSSSSWRTATGRLASFAPSSLPNMRSTMAASLVAAPAALAVYDYGPPLATERVPVHASYAALANIKRKLEAQTPDLLDDYEDDVRITAPMGPTTARPRPQQSPAPVLMLKQHRVHNNNNIRPQTPYQSSPTAAATTLQQSLNSHKSRQSFLHKLPGEFHESAVDEDAAQALEQAAWPSALERARSQANEMAIKRAKLWPHSAVHLQQVYIPPFKPTSGSPDSQQPQEQQQRTVFSLATAPGGLQGFLSGQTGATVLGSNGQRDLAFQPQTIQITTLPNAAVNGLTPAVLRFNNVAGPAPAALATNQMSLSTDALGRPVYMVNADRRQIDWSFWIWPIIALTTIPLLLGALFVPIFLRTIVVVIQILQSLGLLLPISHALSQQIAQAAAAQSAPSATAIGFIENHSKIP